MKANIGDKGIGPYGIEWEVASITEAEIGTVYNLRCESIPNGATAVEPPHKDFHCLEDFGIGAPDFRHRMKRYRDRVNELEKALLYIRDYAAEIDEKHINAIAKGLLPF
jgi:hypothetical protein